MADTLGHGTAISRQQGHMTTQLSHYRARMRLCSTSLQGVRIPARLPSSSAVHVAPYSFWSLRLATCGVPSGAYFQDPVFCIHPGRVLTVELPASCFACCILQLTGMTFLSWTRPPRRLESGAYARSPRASARGSAGLDCWVRKSTVHPLGVSHCLTFYFP